MERAIITGASGTDHGPLRLKYLPDRLRQLFIAVTAEKRIAVRIGDPFHIRELQIVALRADPDIRLSEKVCLCLGGDGSIQMNLQELQTIQTNQLPIKIFVINNNGYHSIRQTQTNFWRQIF